MIKIFTLTDTDYVKYSKFVQSRVLNSSPIKKKRAFIRNVLTWLVIGFVLTSVFKGKLVTLAAFHWPTALIVSIPLLLFMLMVFYYSNLIQKRMRPNSDGLLLGEKKIEFCEKGMTDTTSLGHSFYKWDAVQDVVKNDGSLYVFLDKALAEIFPSTSFESDEEIEHLILYIDKNRHNKSLHQMN